MPEGLKAKIGVAALAFADLFSDEQIVTADDTLKVVNAIIEATREQVFSDIARRDPRMMDALRSCGLIA